MRKRSSLLTGLLVGVAAVALAAGADLSGKWKLTTKGARGERTSDVTLAQSGETLTVTSKDQNGNDVKSEGAVKGSEVTWTRKIQTPNGEFSITFKGKVEGDKITGTTETPRGAGEFTAERVKE